MKALTPYQVAVIRIKREQAVYLAATKGTR
jgi:hypothetical protein